MCDLSSSAPTHPPSLPPSWRETAHCYDRLATSSQDPCETYHTTRFLRRLQIQHLRVASLMRRPCHLPTMSVASALSWATCSLPRTLPGRVEPHTRTPVRTGTPCFRWRSSPTSRIFSPSDCRYYFKTIGACDSFENALFPHIVIIHLVAPAATTVVEGPIL